jgi:hypothetical protein
VQVISSSRTSSRSRCLRTTHLSELVACLLRPNKNTIWSIFQLRHWQMPKRPVGFPPPHPGAAAGDEYAERATDFIAGVE